MRKKPESSDVTAAQIMMAQMVQAAAMSAASQDASRTKRNYIAAVSRIACSVAEHKPDGDALAAIGRMLDEMAFAQRGT